MESVVEIVLEKCLNIENAIAEHDEAGDESEAFDIIKEFKLYCTKFPEMTLNRPVTILNQKSPDTVSLYFEYYKEINPPPPKA
jgi:hypothetical protein